MASHVSDLEIGSRVGSYIAITPMFNDARCGRYSAPVDNFLHALQNCQVSYDVLTQVGINDNLLFIDVVSCID